MPESGHCLLKACKCVNNVTLRKNYVTHIGGDLLIFVL